MDIGKGQTLYNFKGIYETDFGYENKYFDIRNIHKKRQKINQLQNIIRYKQIYNRLQNYDKYYIVKVTDNKYISRIIQKI